MIKTELYICFGDIQTHVNPCFVCSSLSDDPRPLQKDSWASLQDGDLFSLLPGQLIYRVVAVGDSGSSRYLHLISMMCPRPRSPSRPKSNKAVGVVCGGGRRLAIREKDD